MTPYSSGTPPVSWRQVHRGSPPNDVYVAARQKIKERTDKETT